MLTALAFIAMIALPTYEIHLDQVRQTIDNFGASDSWTIEPLSRWPESTRNKIADLLFSPGKGIALSAWRTNIGGGINHKTINNPMRTVDTYEVSKGVYDWSRTPGQRWMLEAAKTRKVPEIIAYSITPTMRMTTNGYTNCTDKVGTTNLKPDMLQDYAAYLADVVDYYLKKGYPVTHLSPINEPDWEWNGVPQASSQEGNRASNTDVMAVNKACAAELAKRNLKVKVLTPEASTPSKTYEFNKGMNDKYHAEYGDYAKAFSKDLDWFRSNNAVYGYHAYWSDGWKEIIPTRKKVKEALKSLPGVKVWQTEYCQMNGPRGEGGWGRDLGMTLALNVARLIHFDLTIVESSAWQWWLAVSDGDYKDGLIYVDDLEKNDGPVFASKTLWAIGNWSKFVRPGMKRLTVTGPEDTVDSLLTSAFVDMNSGRVVTVIVNTTNSSETTILKLDGKWNAVKYLTSDRPGEDLKKAGAMNLSAPFVVPSRTVMTIVCDRIRS